MPCFVLPTNRVVHLHEHTFDCNNLGLAFKDKGLYAVSRPWHVLRDGQHEVKVTKGSPEDQSSAGVIISFDVADSCDLSKPTGLVCGVDTSGSALTLNMF